MNNENNMNKLEKQLKIIKIAALIGLIGGSLIGLFAIGVSLGERIFLVFFLGALGLFIGLIFPSLGTTYKWTAEKIGPLLSSCNPFKGDEDGSIWTWIKVFVFMPLLGVCVSTIILSAPFVSIKRYFTIKKQLEDGNIDEENSSDGEITHIRETPQYQIYLEVAEALKQSGYEIENITFNKGLIKSFVKHDLKNYGMLFAVYNAGPFSNGISDMKGVVEHAHRIRERSAVYWPEGRFVGGFTAEDGFYSYDEEWLNILQTFIN